MYFAEIQMLQNNQKREFNVYVNGNLFFTSFILFKLSSAILQYTSPIARGIEIWLNKTTSSTLSPLLNAIEVYREKVLNKPETGQMMV